MSVEALEPSWEARRQRSLDLVRRAVQELFARGQKPTIPSIHAVTKQIDPLGRGVHPSTYYRNPDVSRIVSRAIGRDDRIPRTLDLRGVSTRYIKRDRDLGRAYHRLLHKSKPDLAARVLVLEMEVIQLRTALAERHREELLRAEQGT